LVCLLAAVIDDGVSRVELDELPPTFFPPTDSRDARLLFTLVPNLISRVGDVPQLLGHVAPPGHARRASPMRRDGLSFPLSKSIGGSLALVTGRPKPRRRSNFARVSKIIDSFRLRFQAATIALRECSRLKAFSLHHVPGAAFT